MVMVVSLAGRVRASGGRASGEPIARFARPWGSLALFALAVR
jgi:hypothetical protein